MQNSKGLNMTKKQKGVDKFLAMLEKHDTFIFGFHVTCLVILIILLCFEIVLNCSK